MIRHPLPYMPANWPHESKDAVFNAVVGFIKYNKMNKSEYLQMCRDCITELL